MVRVLRDNPGTIHSFQEFRDRLACTPLFTLIPPSPAPAARETPPISIADSAALSRAQVSALDRRVATLRAQLRRADTAAKTALSCTKQPCVAALRRATRPAALRTELALLSLMRQTIDDQDSVTERRKLGALPDAEIVRRTKQIQRRLRILTARTTADGIRATLATGSRVFATDTSSATRALRRRLVVRLAAARRAQRQAAAMPGLAPTSPAAPSSARSPARCSSTPSRRLRPQPIPARCRPSP